MKNILSYYYHFAQISLHYRDGVYFFEKDQVLYIFKEVKRNPDEIKEIYQLLLKYPSHYHKIMLNRDGQIITLVEQRPYVLLKVQVRNTAVIPATIFLEKDRLMLEHKNFTSLYRVHWSNLWSMKVDYLEYQIEHIQKKYPLLASSFHYYVGLAENAISYAEDTKLYEKKELKDQVVYSHIRLYPYVTVLDYYDPFTIILDHPSRDVAGYLKNLFFTGNYREEEIFMLLKKLSFSKYGYRMLISRMLYPSYYFDLYEEITLGLKEENEVKKIIQKAEGYRDYMRMIYALINQIIEIPPVDWI